MVMGGPAGQMPGSPPWLADPGPHRKHYRLEKRYGDDFVATQELSETVPALGQVLRVLVLTWHNDRPVLVRWSGGDDPELPVLMIPTVGQNLTPHPAAPLPPQTTVPDAGFGPASAAADVPAGEAARKALDQWLRRFARERWGIRLQEWYQHSRLVLTANTPASSAAPGNVVPGSAVPGRVFYELILCATASRLDDLPEDSDWARRTVTTRDLNRTIHERYREIDEVLQAAHDDYLVRRARRAAPA